MRTNSEFIVVAHNCPFTRLGFSVKSWRWSKRLTLGATCFVMLAFVCAESGFAQFSGGTSNPWGGGTSNQTGGGPGPQLGNGPRGRYGNAPPSGVGSGRSSSRYGDSHRSRGPSGLGNGNETDSYDYYCESCNGRINIDRYGSEGGAIGKRCPHCGVKWEIIGQDNEGSGTSSWGLSGRRGLAKIIGVAILIMITVGGAIFAAVKTMLAGANNQAHRLSGTSQKSNRPVSNYPQNNPNYGNGQQYGNTNYPNQSPPHNPYQRR